MTAAADHEAEGGEAEQERLRKLFCELTHAPKYKFPRDHERMNAPADRGVYVIYDPNGEPAHVGRTPRAKSGIRQRLKDHLAGRSSFTNKHLKGDASKLRTGYEFQWVAVCDPRLRALLEAYAIGQLCPAHIGHGFLMDED